MAYEDDKSMTKMVRNVHVAVMHTGYTLARVAVLRLSILAGDDGRGVEARFIAPGVGRPHNHLQRWRASITKGEIR